MIEINTLELGKLPENSDGTALYDWAKFIDAETEEELDMLAERNPQVGKAAVILRELSADERARDMFERREKGRRDAADREKGALKKQAIEFTRNAINLGLDTDAIIKLTGLTREEIEALRDTK